MQRLRLLKMSRSLTVDDCNNDGAFVLEKPYMMTVKAQKFHGSQKEGEPQQNEYGA